VIQRNSGDADTHGWMARGLADVAKRAESVITPRAFPDIYAAYFGFVWRCLRGLGVPERLLDDAAQDVFVAVHRRLPEFRGDSSLRTWLYGIVRHIALNSRRGERRHGGVMSFETEPASPAPDPHESAQDREAAEFVAGFVAKLDEKKRDVFVLALLEQMTIPEVADTLGVPLNTAYTRLRSVRQEFARALAEQRGKP
jgi:RNA polymerase sigma-70 factor (ECF subfamily)